MKIADQWDVLMEARQCAPVTVHLIAEKLGIKLKIAFLAKGISGMLEKIGDSFLITLNETDSFTRQRFTLAHELGHYMLHRDLVGSGVDDDCAYRSTQIGKYHNTLIGSAEETEANKFAANLLMPKDLVNSEWEKTGTTVQSLAKLFQVSEHAMSIRLGVTYEAV